MASNNDPVTALENWGRDLAKRYGLNPKEVTYDSDMLHLVFNDMPGSVALESFHQAAKQSDFIKLPYMVGEFEDSSEDMADDDEVVWTLCFYQVK